MRITLFIAGLFTILAFGFLLFHSEFDAWLAAEKGLEWLRGQGPLAGLLGAGLIASDLFLPVPASGLTAALGEIYGGFVGGLYASAGSLSGGFLAYGLVRLLGRRAALFIGGKDLDRLQRFFEKKGAFAIATTRVVPLVPEILCSLAGLAPMPLKRFSIALASGSIPLSFVFSFYGSASESEPLKMLLIATAIPTCVFPFAWWLLLRDSGEKKATRSR